MLPVAGSLRILHRSNRKFSAIPSAPLPVKALRHTSTADAALRGLDRHLRSRWWLDMRSMRFSILKRIDLSECIFGQRRSCVPLP
jgi:hypothetical protein